MADSAETILARLLAAVDDRYDKTPGSFFYDTQKPFTLEAEKLYALIETVADRAFVSTATGPDLDEKVMEAGLTRLPPTAASGTVTISGMEGTRITAGIKVKSDELLFTITESGSIPASGSLVLCAVCDQTGEAGNVPAGSVTSLAVMVSGVFAVTNEAAFTGGYDGESDEDLRERYRKHVTRPPTSGNKYHYEEWAKEADGRVGDALCLPLWNGPGTVKVLIVTSERTPPDEALVAKVKAYIDGVRPVGADVTVEGASPVSVDVSVTLKKRDGADETTVAAAVRESLEAFFRNVSFRSDYVSYAHAGRAILETTGVADYRLLTLDGEASDVALADGGIPVLGEFEVTVDE